MIIIQHKTVSPFRSKYLHRVNNVIICFTTLHLIELIRLRSVMDIRHNRMKTIELAETIRLFINYNERFDGSNIELSVYHQTRPKSFYSFE